MTELETLQPHPKDLGGGFVVRRLLPSAQRPSVGPFVFFDHFGPITAQPGDNHDGARIRTSAWPPSPTCSTARCCTATRSAACSASSPAR